MHKFKWNTVLKWGEKFVHLGLRVEILKQFKKEAPPKVVCAWLSAKPSEKDSTYTIFEKRAPPNELVERRPPTTLGGGPMWGDSLGGG